MNSKKTPDLAALAIAAEMQQLLAPAEIILTGSRAAGEHRDDSGVDLMAVCQDAAAVARADGLLRGLPEGEPPVHVYTITQDEFRRLAPQAQSFPGQAVRHGVTPEGKRLDCWPVREASPEEIREGAGFWLQLARIELREFLLRAVSGWPWARSIAPRHAQWALQWAIKAVLYAGDDPVRYRRDAALMWLHIQGVRPLTDRCRVEAVERLLAATAESGGKRCCLTAFVEAHRRHRPTLVLGEELWDAVSRCLEPAVHALMAEARDRTGMG